MKRITSRSLIALGVVVALGLSTPGLAFAGSGPGSASQKAFNQELAAFLSSRQAIQSTFQSSVSTARATYFSALSQSASSAQRSAARQAMETAIIQAAAARSAALTALGNRPVKFSTQRLK
jgi:hypothetical protein